MKNKNVINIGDLVRCYNDNEKSCGIVLKKRLGIYDTSIYVIFVFVFLTQEILPYLDIDLKKFES